MHRGIVIPLMNCCSISWVWWTTMSSEKISVVSVGISQFQSATAFKRKFIIESWSNSYRRAVQNYQHITFRAQLHYTQKYIYYVQSKSASQLELISKSRWPGKLPDANNRKRVTFVRKRECARVTLVRFINRSYLAYFKWVQRANFKIILI